MHGSLAFAALSATTAHALGFIFHCCSDAAAIDALKVEVAKEYDVGYEQMDGRGFGDRDEYIRDHVACRADGMGLELPDGWDEAMPQGDNGDAGMPQETVQGQNSSSQELDDNSTALLEREQERMRKNAEARKKREDDAARGQRRRRRRRARPLNDT